MKYKNILLDLDQTLYDYHQAHKKAIRPTLLFLSQKTKIAYPMWEKHYSLARNTVHQRLNGTAASHNRLLYFQQACEMLKINPTLYAHKAADLYWDTFLKNMTAYKGTNRFFAAFKKSKICIITDLTADIQFKKIQRLKLEPYINCIVTSEEAGVEKPDPLIFKLALKKLGSQKESTIMIGDDLKKDIFGAARLKIKSFWLNIENRSIKYKRSPLIQEFHNWNELIKMLS